MKVQFQMSRVIVISYLFFFNLSSAAWAGPFAEYCSQSQISNQTKILLSQWNLLDKHHVEIVEYYNGRISESARLAEIARIQPGGLKQYEKHAKKIDELYLQMLSKTQPIEREALDIENKILFGRDGKCFSKQMNYTGKGTLKDFVNARVQCYQNQTGIAYQTGSSPNVGSCSQFFSCLQGKGFVRSQSGRFSTPQGYEIMCNQP